MIARVELQRTGGRTRLCARVAFEDRAEPSRRVWIELPGDAEEPLRGDAFLPGLLVPAAAMGERRLRIDAPVSPALLEGARRGARILAEWWPALAPPSLEGPESAAPPARPLSAALFSAGVDSWFTALSHARDPRLTHLIFVEGFDFGLDERSRREIDLPLVRRAAGLAGKELLVLATNLREAFPEALWLAHHGPVAAAAALALGTRFERVLAPGTDRLDQEVPRGSHRRLDGLWRSESGGLAHDGSRWSRHEKLGRTARAPGVLETLRCCNQPRGSLINCGRCSKCLGAMYTLRLEGLLERAETFPRTIEPDQFDPPFEIPAPNWWVWLERVRDPRASCEPELARAVERAVERSARASGRRARYLLERWAGGWARACFARAWRTRGEAGRGGLGPGATAGVPRAISA